MPGADRIGSRTRWQIAPVPISGPIVGEAVMRIERMIVAVLVSVLALLMVQGTASASGDGMPYNGITTV